LYWGINAFKKGYYPRTNIVKDEKEYLFADTYCVYVEEIFLPAIECTSIWV